jgi:hypothetical protein
MCGRDGFCRHRTESFRDALGPDVVRRDRGDKPVDLWTLMCPVANGCGCLGRISLSPVCPRQGPAKLGLSMTSCLCPSRGRPVACVEDHEPSLADHLRVGCRGLENERTDLCSRGDRASAVAAGDRATATSRACPRGAAWRRVSRFAWLQVSAETIAERLAAREVGSALEWHLQRAEEIRSNALAHDLFDFVVDGERPVRDVSVEVLQRAGWH